MADTKITALTALTAADPANDVIPIVDVSDTSMAASGTTKKISVNNILGASGTATLASATITGDLTVRTDKLAVRSNGVGIGTTSPTSYSGYTTLAILGGANGGVIDINTSGGVTAGGMQIASTATSTIFDVSGPSGGAAASVLFRTGAYGALGERYRIDGTGQSTWSVAGSTAMTLNSTGLGVGASPANGKLIVGADATTDGNGSWNTTLRNTVGAATTAPKTGLAFSGYWNGTSNFANFAGISGGKENTTDANTAGILTMWTSPNGGSPTTRLTIDSSGNLGIGVTPSAWATYKAVSVGGIGASVFGLGSSQAGVAQGAFFNNGAGSGWAYSATSQVPTYYLQINGENIWNIAASGTAGAQITAWTPAMKLDASGNLILLSPSTPPTLATNGQLVANATSNTNLRFSYRGSDGVTRTANLTLA